MTRITAGRSSGSKSHGGSSRSSTSHSSVCPKYRVQKSTYLLSAAAIQNVILFLLGLPTYIAALQQPEHLSTSDYVLGALALVILVLEFVSDNQQYSYQSFKHEGVSSNTQWPGARINWTQRDVQRGFCTRGLWAWSRHPNFFCEQTFWVRSLLTYAHLSRD